MLSKPHPSYDWRGNRLLTTTEKYRSDLETSCLVLDTDVLERNLQKMQAAVERAGKNLHPHVKTHKCSALAKRQMEVGAIGVCVAKVSEAEALVKVGLDSILITGPIVTPSKVERLVELLPTAPSLMIVIDHPRGIALLDAALRLSFSIRQVARATERAGGIRFFVGGAVI
jgi:D-serine deaminase-like pyridoxal phosphate-dependent protein